MKSCVTPALSSYSFLILAPRQVREGCPGLEQGQGYKQGHLGGKGGWGLHH